MYVSRFCCAARPGTSAQRFYLFFGVSSNTLVRPLFGRMVPGAYADPTEPGTMDTLSRLEDVKRQDRRDAHVRYVYELPDSQVYGDGSNDIGLFLRIAVGLGDVLDHLQ